MNCREFADFLMAYLDGELPPGQLQVFEDHLRRCPDCETYLAGYREAVRLGRSLGEHPEDGVPEEVPEELVRAIVAARPREPS